ncbi:M56 family metallopeptidase [Flavobacterium sp. W1B]|uniref:M56 family metallopeptidase n=1 Tax=Flavobacterium sp. W1B TaxID=3394146 RepID=UPI0039BD82CB
MDTLSIYLIKSSGLLILFFLAYHFMLRKETFFTANRWFLLAGLISSVLLPFVVFTKIVWVNPSPANINWSNIPSSAPIENNDFEINWYWVLIIGYAIGLTLFLILFLLDFYSLTKILKNKKIHQQADFKFIDLTANVAPFSFFKTIVYNSSLYSKSELEAILEHEKVHSEQNHTVDVLISRLFCTVFWFNPVVWFYKKAIVQNLEFIADSEASKKISDKKAYQITLLKITTHENCVAITNHFYQSLIKKRIVMLNKNQSKKRNYWKYFSILPALIAFVLLFQVEVIAQEKKSDEIELKVVKIDKTDLNDTVKKKKVIEIQPSNINDLTEIYIDGKKVSKSEMDDLDPSDIATMDVNKKGAKSIIKIISKSSNEITDDKKLIISGVNMTNLNLEKTDPTNLNNKQTSKTSRTIKIIRNSTNGIPVETEIYIDGIKSNQTELDNLNPYLIERMDINKSNVDRKTIEIITKSKNDVNQSKLDVEQAKRDIEQAKKDVEQAKRDIEQAKKDVQQAKRDVEQAKKDAQQAKRDIELAKKNSSK